MTTKTKNAVTVKVSAADTASVVPSHERPLILALRVLNFRSISLAEVGFNTKTGVVTIQGPNKSGKSDLLMAAEWAVRGKGLRNEPDKRKGALAKPQSLVRDGEKEARVEVTIWDQEEYKLVKTQDGDGVEVLRIKDSAGRASDSTDLLKRWISAWSFNAAYLDRAINAGDVNEWSPIILSLAEFELTVAECMEWGVPARYRRDPVQAYDSLEREEKRLFELRAASSGKIAEAKAIAEGITLEKGTPETEPDFKAKGEERVALLAEKGECTRKRVAAEGNAAAADERLQKGEEESDRLCTEIARIQGRQQQLTAAVDAEKETAATYRREAKQHEFKRQAKLDSLEAEFTGFSALIGKWQKRKQQQEAQAEWDAEIAEAAKRTARLEACRQFRLDLPGRVVLPIEGMAVRGQEVLLTAKNDAGELETRVWTEWNEATRLAFSVQIAAQKLEPSQIGFVVIPSAALLTAKTFATLRKFAKKLGIVLICEYSTDDLKRLGDQDVWLEVR